MWNWVLNVEIVFKVEIIQPWSSFDDALKVFNFQLELFFTIVIEVVIVFFEFCELFF